MSLKIFSLHKKESISFQNTQDKYAFSKDLSTLALSDGATQAYESGLWAEILVSSYIIAPTNKSPIFLNLLLKAANRFNREVRQSDLASQNKAIEGLLDKLQDKGSYCTFVGVEIRNDVAKVASYGDSVLFHFRKNRLINSVPVNKSSDLDLFSNFLNTNIINDQEYFIEKNFQADDIKLESGDILILSSDAFSKYLLDNNSCVDELIEISTFKAFSRFIENEWQKDNLEEDDITILLYQHNGSDKVVQIEPDSNFKFPDKPPSKPPKPVNPKPPKSNLSKYVLGGILLILITFICQRYIFTGPVIPGCMDDTACNYDSTATDHKGDISVSCRYAEKYYDCNGVCINDSDGDGVCDELEIAGCTDKTMFNYVKEATDDDGTCIQIIRGCIDSSAQNYSPRANTDDGSCVKKQKKVNLKKFKKRKKPEKTERFKKKKKAVNQKPKTLKECQHKNKIVIDDNGGRRYKCANKKCNKKLDWMSPDELGKLKNKDNADPKKIKDVREPKVEEPKVEESKVEGDDE